MDESSPLTVFFDEIDRAIAADLNIVAIASALAIPAICASLEMEDGRSHGPEYKEWCRRYICSQPAFSGVTPEELYSLRNGMLHQGRAEFLVKEKGGGLTQRGRLSKIVFMVGENARIVNSASNDVYAYSVREFCAGIRAAACSWYAVANESEVVRRNMDAMIRYRPFKAQG